MQHAVSNLHFEQASVHREDLRAIQWLYRRTLDLATARENYTFVYAVASHPCCGGGRPIWYLIRKGMIEGAIAAPNSEPEKKQVLKRIRQWKKEDNSVGTPYASRPESLALVTSWFRKYRSELKSTFDPSDSKKIQRIAKRLAAFANTSATSEKPRNRSRSARATPARSTVKV